MPGYRLLLVLVLSAVLLGLRDKSCVQQLQFVSGYLTEPMLYLADWPVQVVYWAQDHWVSRDQLQKRNQALQQETLLLSRHVQKMAALISENERLRALLHSSDRLSEKVVIAEIVDVDADPYRHEVILDQGLNAGMQVGQTVLDADGLIGQVIKVHAHTSRVQ